MLIKRSIASFLALVCILSLTACGTKYEPVPSTEEESRIVMTLELDGEEYEIRYELYRAFFLAYKSNVDKGDDTVWQGAEQSKYVELINEMIISAVCEIYSAFHICSEVGINVFSSSYDDEIEDYISDSVDNIILLTEKEENKRIDKDEAYVIYLERLKANNLSYEAHILLYRYQLALEAIEKYYIGTFNPNNPNPGDKEGKLKYTKDDVVAFYNSESSVRILQAFISSDANDALTRAESIRLALQEKAAVSENAVATHIIANSTADPNAVKAGTVIGKYQLDEMYWLEFTKTAFDLSVGEVSEVLKVSTDTTDGYYVIYKGAKSESNLESNYADIEMAYRYNELGRIKHEAKQALVKSVSTTDAYSQIVHAQIGM